MNLYNLYDKWVRTLLGYFRQDSTQPLQHVSEKPAHERIPFLYRPLPLYGESEQQLFPEYNSWLAWRKSLPAACGANSNKILMLLRSENSTIIQLGIEAAKATGSWQWYANEALNTSTIIYVWNWGSKVPMWKELLAANARVSRYDREGNPLTFLALGRLGELYPSLLNQIIKSGSCINDVDACGNNVLDQMISLRLEPTFKGDAEIWIKELVRDCYLLVGHGARFSSKQADVLRLNRFTDPTFVASFREAFERHQLNAYKPITPQPNL